MLYSKDLCKFVCTMWCNSQLKFSASSLLLRYNACKENHLISGSLFYLETGCIILGVPPIVRHIQILQMVRIAVYMERSRNCCTWFIVGNGCYASLHPILPVWALESCQSCTLQAEERVGIRKVSSYVVQATPTGLRNMSIFFESWIPMSVFLGM